jgi:CHAT domain-containing protein
MQAFYQHLRKGEQPGAALRSAKLEMLQVVIYLTQVDTTCSMAGYGGIPAEPERV